MRAALGIVAAVTLLLACRPGEATRLTEVLIAIEPTAIDFGALTIGSVTSRKVKVSNVSAAALSVKSIAVTQDSGGAFGCMGCEARTLTSTDSFTFTVFARPTSEGSLTALGFIQSDATNSPTLSIALKATVAGRCVPKTCAAASRDCDFIDDGCGGSVACGTCTSPSTCGAVDAGVCGCAGENDAQLCQRFGRNCSSLTAIDGCGVERTVSSCGTCANGASCGASGVCACEPESDAVLCARSGATCGALIASDRCAAVRTIASCGTCAAPQTCGAAGAANTCGCGESDAAFCVRVGVACGPSAGVDLCGIARSVASCGGCSGPGNTCGGAGTAGQCGCVGETDAALCSRLSTTCGPLSAVDTCGATRSVPSCGACTSPGSTCGGAGTPGSCGCTAESDESMCARLGRNCNSLTAQDNCGTSRTIASCGICTGAGASCGGSGSAGVCGCTGESDAAFCADHATNCGPLTANDRCGRSRTVASCGTCSGTGVNCGGGSVTGQCGCTPESVAAVCSRLGKNCGAASGTDNCGATRTIASCGTCSAMGASCGGSGSAGICGCTPESETSLCARLGANCGSLSATDNCGGARNVTSCGTCTAPGDTCGGGGTNNQCGCAPEAEAAACARLGATCGALSATDHCGDSQTFFCGFCFGLGQTCGGGGQANTCGCTPESDTAFCTRLSATCGSLTRSDNCGASRTVACGTCTVPTHVCSASQVCTSCSGFGPLYGPAAGTNGGQRVFDSQGALYMLSYRGGLVKVPPGGGFVTIVANATSVSGGSFGWSGQPLVLADDSVLLSGETAIYRFSTSGIAVWSAPYAPLTFGPGLLQDSQGQVLDTIFHRLYSSSGALVTTMTFSTPQTVSAMVLTPQMVLMNCATVGLRGACFDGTLLGNLSEFTDVRTGLARGADGSLYFGASPPFGGTDSTIYRAPQGGGSPTVFATLPGLTALTSLVGNVGGTDLFASGSTPGNDGSIVWKVSLSDGSRVVYGCVNTAGARPCGAVN